MVSIDTNWYIKVSVFEIIFEQKTEVFDLNQYLSFFDLI